MSTADDPPRKEAPLVLGNDPDSLSPEFHAWVDSMTPEQRLQVLKRFYERWDPPAPTEQTPPADSGSDSGRE